MVQTLSVFLLAFAVSLDSFSVGLTYGLRKVRIPILSITVISCCSAIILAVAMGIGHFFEKLFSGMVAERIGGIILIILGAWVLYQFFRPEKIKETVDNEVLVIKFEIKALGIVISILKKPMTADFDRSGVITGIEAFVLGLALSLDAFGVGIGAAMLGLSPFYLAVAVAVMSSLFVYLGMKFGAWLARYNWLHKLSFIPGILLIIIGMIKL